MVRIAIIAAEASGDLLGGGLMQSLKQLLPEVEFEGVGGPRMQAVGMDVFEPMESLSIMGIVEVLRHLPRLLKLRASLFKRWSTDPPDLFIGIDAPDFNLTLERKLRKVGVPVAHYVSPTVWAWREGRVKQLHESVDILLSIFPFEVPFLEKRGVPAVYVGHRLAQEIPLEPDRAAARTALGLPQDAPVLAILPGSRRSEVERLARPFLQTGVACAREIPDLRIVTPLVNEGLSDLWQEQKVSYAPSLNTLEALHASRKMLAAADVVLTASGTATFEALLSKRPMVVGYKLNQLTYLIAKWLKLVKLEHVAMANLLSGEALAPEFIQDACEPENLAPAVLNFFRDSGRVEHIVKVYRQLHQDLILDTDAQAAQALLQLLYERD